MPVSARTVHDIMVAPVQTIAPEAPAIQAAQIMVRSGIRHLVVSDGLRGVAGVVTQRQILKHFSPWLTEAVPARTAAGPPPSLEVRKIMTTPAVTVAPDMPIPGAAAILASKRIGCLPVVESGRGLVGIVTTVDVLQFLANGAPVYCADDYRVFAPPASVSENRELVLPAEYFPNIKPSDQGVFALLSYARQGGRIRVRLFKEDGETGKTVGARPATATDGHIKIAVGDFLDYYDVAVRGPLEVSATGEDGCVVLSPVSSGKFRKATDRAHVTR